MKKHIEIARQIAAQCWCNDETKDIEKNEKLAEAMAERIAGMLETASTFATGMEYYRGIVERCREVINRAPFAKRKRKQLDAATDDQVPDFVDELADAAHVLEEGVCDLAKLNRELMTYNYMLQRTIKSALDEIKKGTESGETDNNRNLMSAIISSIRVLQTAQNRQEFLLERPPITDANTTQ
jgi:2,4-dienoyl-CoA reductase-like NADH-dependent reductase (Old Yellow Enzyme family)